MFPLEPGDGRRDRHRVVQVKSFKRMRCWRVGTESVPQSVNVQLVGRLDVGCLVDDVEAVAAARLVEHGLILTVPNINRFHEAGSTIDARLNVQPAFTEQEEGSRLAVHDQESAGSQRVGPATIRLGELRGMHIVQRSDAPHPIGIGTSDRSNPIRSGATRRCLLAAITAAGSRAGYLELFGVDVALP
ncbi:MAG: hypothetical protein ABJH75_18200 [Roseibium sp.]|uniref:hypothetical protein n=1 Tax=Roseibium sp. TaxID=1936156 RepID=UPI00329A597C